MTKRTTTKRKTSTKRRKQTEFPAVGSKVKFLYGVDYFTATVVARVTLPTYKGAPIVRIRLDVDSVPDSESPEFDISVTDLRAA